MLVSKKMLSFIDPIFEKITEKHFTTICNQVGIEVEQIIKHPKNIGLQICYIEDVQKHPNADKLNIAKIKLSSNKYEDVVCGAINICPNKYAIYAPVGTVLYDGKKIEQREIRGISSRGMLCGYAEITNIGIESMSDYDKASIVLFDQATLGEKNIDKYLLTDDIIYDLSIPSNRNDLNGLIFLICELFIGLRRESILDWNLKNPFDNILVKPKCDSSVCCDISFIEVDNIPNFQVDWKQKQILMSCGYKIHNNLLDLFNLYTINYGNPIHIYDATNLNIRNLSVRKLEASQKLVCLDGKEYTLPKGAIGIFNGNELINAAGIIGSEKYKFNNNANKIIIEIGNFDPNIIRSTAEKMGINTKASAIFSKPLSSWITQKIFIHVCSFLTDSLLQFKYAHNFDINSPLKISYDYNELYKFIGIDDAINFNECFDNGIYKVAPWRLDVHDQYDVFEEVIKIINVNELEPKPISLIPNESNDYSNTNKINKLRNYLLDQNFLETKTYSLTDEASYDLYNFFDLKHKTTIINPISKIREVMRVSLFDEMLKVIQYNIARKRTIANIFEMQNINTSDDEFFNNLSLVISQPIISNTIEKSIISNSLINIKSLVMNMLLKINVDASFHLIKKNINGKNEEITAIKANKITIGYIHKLSSSELKKYDINTTTYIVSINLDAALECESKFKFKPLSQFPTVHRDLNITLEQKQKISNIINDIKKIKDVHDCYIKDYFEKDSKQIYTIHIIISNLEKTLSTKEIDDIMNEINSYIMRK